MNGIYLPGPFVLRDRTEISDGVAFDPGGRFQASASWNLPADLRCLITSVGAESRAASTAVFALSLADADAYSQTGVVLEPPITVQGSQRVDWVVDITGVFRLQLNVQQTDDDAIISVDSVVLGDARLTGAPCPD